MLRFSEVVVEIVSDTFFGKRIGREMWENDKKRAWVFPRWRERTFTYPRSEHIKVTLSFSFNAGGTLDAFLEE